MSSLVILRVSRAGGDRLMIRKLTLPLLLGSLWYLSSGRNLQIPMDRYMRMRSSSQRESNSGRFIRPAHSPQSVELHVGKEAGEGSWGRNHSGTSRERYFGCCGDGLGTVLVRTRRRCLNWPYEVLRLSAGCHGTDDTQIGTC